MPKWQSVETMQHGAMAGALFETAAVMAIVKSYAAHGRAAPISFYRDHQGREIDVIMEQDGRAFPIEVKLGSRVAETDVAHLRFFTKHEKKAGRGAVVCSALEAVSFDRSIAIVPLSLIN